MSADGLSDLVAVTGDINLSGLTLQIVDTGLLDSLRTYSLLTCSGARTGTFTWANSVDKRWHLLYRPSSVDLLFTNGTILILK